MTIKSSSVHTTIPKKYFEYAKSKKLSWSKLLTKAIEDYMDEDPDLLRNKLIHINEERERVEQQLKKVDQQHQDKKTKQQDMQKGLIPVD